MLLAREGVSSCGLFKPVVTARVQPEPAVPDAVWTQHGPPPSALTLDTYSHVLSSLQQEATSVMAAAILGSASMLPQAASKRAGQNHHVR